MTQTTPKTLPPKDEKWGDWIQILINGGRADQAAAKAMREEILQVCRTIEVLPTRQNVAKELDLSQVAFTRRLKKLGIEEAFKAELQSRRKLSHLRHLETIRDSVEKCHISQDSVEFCHTSPNQP